MSKFTSSRSVRLIGTFAIIHFLATILGFVLMFFFMRACFDHPCGGLMQWSRNVQTFIFRVITYPVMALPNGTFSGRWGLLGFGLNSLLWGGAIYIILEKGWRKRKRTQRKET
jgi:hypothetical protein